MRLHDKLTLEEMIKLLHKINFNNFDFMWKMKYSNNYREETSAATLENKALVLVPTIFYGINDYTVKLFKITGILKYNLVPALLNSYLRMYKISIINKERKKEYNDRNKQQI